MLAVLEEQEIKGESMNDINSVTFTGRLTRDPEQKTFHSGNSVAEFTLAVNRKYNDREETLFISAEAWGKLGEIVSSVASRGSRVLVTGRIKQDNWETEGEKRSKLVLVVDEFMNMSPKVREEEPVGA